MKGQNMSERIVLVTTAHKGVFCGKLVKEEGDAVVLDNAKMAVYWSSNVKGVLGLANTGPLDGCRITPSVPEIKLNGVTAIVDCSDEAVKNWGRDIWD